MPAFATRSLRNGLAIAAFLAVLLACSPPDAPPLGIYRAVVSTDGGDLPFGLELVNEDGGLVAYLVNGPERVRATGVRLEGGTLAIQMPGYQNRIEATFKDGRFEGTLSILRPRGVIRELRLVAVPGEILALLSETRRGAARFLRALGADVPRCGWQRKRRHRGVRAGGTHRHRHGPAPERRRPLPRRRGAGRHAVPLALRWRHRLPLPRDASAATACSRASSSPAAARRNRSAAGATRPRSSTTRPSARRSSPASTGSNSASRTSTATCSATPTIATRGRSCWSPSAAAGARTATTKRRS